MAHKLGGKVAHICCPAVHLSAEQRANASFGSGSTLVWAPRLCSRSARRGADSIVCCRSRGIASNTATSSRRASATASAACSVQEVCTSSTFAYQVPRRVYFHFCVLMRPGQAAV